MKKSLLFFIAALFVSFSYGQNIGIDVANPRIKIDATLKSIIGTSATSVDVHDVSNRGIKVSFGAVSSADTTEFTGMRALVAPGTAGCGNSGDISFYTWECNNSGSREVMRINGSGNVGIRTTAPWNTFSVNGTADFSGEVSIGVNYPVPSAIFEISSTSKGLLFPRMTMAQRDAISSPAEGLLIYQTDAAAGIHLYKSGVWSNLGASHFIGESYGGGIVFYVYDNGRHGLIAATADQNSGAAIRWYGGTNTNTRARADGVGAGLKNTALIIANQATVDVNPFAATVCNEYSVTVAGVTYGDWYMPSEHELNLLYLQKAVVGGFANAFYWSSLEIDAGSAHFQNFSDGGQSINPKNTTMRVRAVRAF